MYPAADVNTPVGLGANVFAQGDHPTCICHEGVDGEGAACVEPIFFHAGFEAGGEGDEGVFQAGECVPTCFEGDTVPQSDEGFIYQVVKLWVGRLYVGDGDYIPALAGDFGAGGDGW